MNRPSAALAGCALLVAGCASATVKSSALVPSPSRTAAVAPTGKAFAVAAPAEQLSAISGPAPRDLGPCRPSAIMATARSRQANDGVLGLITIVGRACSLAVNPDRILLLDDAGRPLPVKTTPAGGINPASSIRPDLTEAGGSVAVGFSWTGSYCGHRPVNVQIPALPAAIRIALDGPAPTCAHGNDSRLTPGVVSGPQAPVEPAPTAWTALRARLVIPKTVHEGPVPLSVVLTTTGTTDVSLAAPCPEYIVTISHPDVAGRGFGGGGDEFTGDFGDLCSRTIVVHPGHPLTLAIPSVHYTPEAPWEIGGTFLAQWAIAGVPTASASATIR